MQLNTLFWSIYTAMINFTHIKSQKLFSLSAIILSGLLLQACGGQRDEPFNASSSSSASSIAVTNLTSGNNQGAGGSDYNFTHREILEDEFKGVWKLYTNQDPSESILSKADFTKGQVVLVDLGRLSECDPKSALDNFAVYQDGVGELRVVLTYKRADGVAISSSSSSSSVLSSSSSSSSSSSNSSSSSAADCGNANYVQNYYFYYVKSLDKIYYDETPK